MADQKEKDTVSVHNRGIRTYHVPARLMKPGETLAKEDRLELVPGGTVDVPADVAATLLGPQGYRDLVDAAKMAPAQTKKLAALEAENAELKAKLAEKEGGGDKKDAADEDEQKKKPRGK